eukprot:CAMPEP_0194667196 /NCGR_PEP_ID=MMETSP0295-20121207/3184_1 /TAXON_ID=39354 /ORGANISM="Heterosigma akashiwo, Strain CCMP2393" /LENGTH=326 /DNA_ID=CAMNT_0039549625 /DNA_START=138 /DNA_END=1116 /DNA_ORIENTATION=+
MQKPQKSSSSEKKLSQQRLPPKPSASCKGFLFADFCLDVRGGSDVSSDDEDGAAVEEVSDTTESDDEEMAATKVSGKDMMSEKLKGTKKEGAIEVMKRNLYKFLDENFNDITKDPRFDLATKMVPQIAVSIGITKFINSLDHTKPSSIARARVAYVLYLLLTQILVFFARLRVARLDDPTEVVVPNPMAAMMEKAMQGQGGAGDMMGEMAKTAAAGALSKKMTAREYDLQQLDAIRNGLFMPMVINLFLHLKRGMVKPMMIQAAMGLYQLTQQPVLKVHILGKSPEGDLARPYKSGQMVPGMGVPPSAPPAAEAEAEAEEASGEET